VHNLRLINFRDPAPADWAAPEHAAALAHRSRRCDRAGGLALSARCRARHSDTGTLPPLLYALGARRAADKIHIFNDEVTSSLSMLSVTIG
jgi:aromatic ring-opening dioxygenase catalytic subunit (LigB family)